MLTALALGDAVGVFEEAEAALAMFQPDAIGATSNIGIEWPGRLDYWATLHAERCADWVGIAAAIEKRRAAAGRNWPQVWGYTGQAGSPGLDRVTDDWNGGSGLLLVKVLREEGFERIILAGMPMTAEGSHFYRERGSWSAFDRYRSGWRAHKGAIAPYVRSMSGWTKQLLGAPTPEWLAAR